MSAPSDVPPRPSDRPDDARAAAGEVAADDAADVAAGVAAGRDRAAAILPREAARAELGARVAELTEALAARDGLLAVAAHELRNPMTPILAHAQRLRRRVGAGEASPAQVEETLGRLESLIGTYVRRATMLLDVSRLTLGAYAPEPERVDAAALARDLVASLEPAARYAGCALTLRAPPALEAVLDPAALEQILDNLVGNAVKYGPGAPVEVVLTGARGRLRAAVRDGGPGVSEGDRARLTERFERALAKGAGVGGLGVGLWVCGRLAAAMGGTIEVEGAGEEFAGRGSVFTLDVPLGMDSSDRA